MENHTGGPSEAVLKLVFPFLNEKEWFYKSDIFNRADLVCKRWNTILRSDDVWRPICDRKIAWYEMVQENLRNQRRENPDMMDVEESEYDSSMHMILAKQMSKRPVSGRTCREIYILSERMGGALGDHKCSGPDYRSPEHMRSAQEDNRTLRERCTQDYERIILPTINTLRQIFHDPQKTSRQEHVSDTKSRLLEHARKEKALIRREPPYLEKGQLAASLGQSLLAANIISFKSLGDHASSPPLSTYGVTIGDIVGGLLSIGNLFTTYTLDWPINPVDNLCFLIRCLWPKRSDMDVSMCTSQDEEDEMWNAAMKKWWSSLSDPIQSVLIEIYNEWRLRFTDGDNLPQIANASDVPHEALSFIVEGKYIYFRKVLAEKILSKFDPSLLDSIFTVYKQQTKSFSDKIQQTYQSVYEGKDSELNAKVLLDIFLEVAHSERHYLRDIFLEVAPSERHSFYGPEMTTEYCNGLMERMQNALDIWNQLANASLTSDDTLWDPQTLKDMIELPQKFDTFERRGTLTQEPSREFDTGFMVERFLRQQLISPGPVCTIPAWYNFDRDTCKKTINGITDDTSAMSHADLESHHSKIQETAIAFKNFSTYYHTREHAMIALIPLLPNLSRADAKRLIYALFTKFTCGRRNNQVESELSRDISRLYVDNVPCSPSSDPSENLESMRGWINQDYSSELGSHGVRERLFGLGLPDNIISAMGEFLVERLYSTSPYDVDGNTLANAMGVLPHMERFCYENPSKASLVWEHLGQAIDNARSLFGNLEAEDIGPEQREVFDSVISRLVVACIKTRAQRLAPVLERLYDDVMLAHLPPTIVQFDTLIERINDAPRVFPDTSFYYNMRFVDEEL